MQRIFFKGKQLIFRGKQASGNWIYGSFVTGEYCVTIADNEFRNIINEEGSHIVEADTVEYKVEGDEHWIKLPSVLAEQRKRAYEEYHSKRNQT